MSMPVSLTRRALFAAAFWPAMAFAHSAKVGEILVGHAWALPTQPGVDGQVFVPLINTGNSEDALVAARAMACATVELRRNARYDDPPLKSFVLPPKKPQPMRPGGPHLRILGLCKPLVLGDRFPIVLDFLNAGEIEVEVYVESTPGQ
jgi:periplasmic copper chaperone A